MLVNVYQYEVFSDQAIQKNYKLRNWTENFCSLFSLINHISLNKNPGISVKYFCQREPAGEGGR